MDAIPKGLRELPPAPRIIEVAPIVKAPGAHPGTKDRSRLRRGRDKCLL